MIEEFNRFAQGISDRITQDLARIKERENVHRLDRALKQFGNAHPEMIAAFRGPYKPAHHYDIHIVVPKDMNPKQRKPQVLYGFDTGLGRYFSVEIPSKQIPTLLTQATESRRRGNTNTESLLVISESFKFAEVSKQQFEEAFASALGDIPLSDAQGVRSALESFPELEHLNKPNFFGPKKSGPAHGGYSDYYPADVEK